MTTKLKTIEDRVADLEREVAALKAALPPASSAPGFGFAEDGSQALTGELAPGADDKVVDLARRITTLETTVAELKSQAGSPGLKDWRRAVGWAKDDPGYGEAMRLGAEWRRRENLKSIRELERRGEIDADPGHRSSQRPGSRRKTIKRAARTT
jgi:hypothetical protein